MLQVIKNSRPGIKLRLCRIGMATSAHPISGPMPMGPDAPKSTRSLLLGCTFESSEHYVTGHICPLKDNSIGRVQCSQCSVPKLPESQGAHGKMGQTGDTWVTDTGNNR